MIRGFGSIATAPLAGLALPMVLAWPAGPGGAPASAAEDVPPPQACARAPHDKLCSTIPHDVSTPKLNAGYSQLGAAQQRPFDNFAWQMFVALNWPAGRDGKPLPGKFADRPDAPRVWEFYPNPFATLTARMPGENDPPARFAAAVEAGTPRRVFSLLSSRSNPKALDPGSILEAGTNNPLIDRNLNFTLYDARINPVEEAFIRKHDLGTVAGQRAYLADVGKSVAWPLGSYADDGTATGGTVGAIELKSAWRILDPLADAAAIPRYYAVDGEIRVDAEHSRSGRPLTIRAKLGLVGLHIVQRTTRPTGFPQDWIWATFEHVDNAPSARNARNQSDISVPLPEVGLPPVRVDRDYSFYNPAYTGPTNVAPPLLPGEKVYKWDPSPPYAAAYANEGKYGTQVVRCFDVYPPTEDVNVYFQKLVAGTVWQNYKLIGAQWMGGVEDPQVENGNIPRYLTNTTMETYVQLQSYGSCLKCHQSAPTAVPGLDGNFSHLLYRAR